MERFFHLYFAGGRYDDRQGIPLAVLPHLAKIEKLIRSVARDLFFDGNEDRRRVSPGFDDAFSPAVTRIEGGGSADLDVGWCPVQEDPNTAFFEVSQSEVIELLDTFRSADPKPPPWLSRESATLLADVLQSLDAGETARWDATAGEEVTVDHLVGPRVRLEADRPRPAVDEAFQVVGRLHRINDDPWYVGVTVWETKRSMTVPVRRDLKAQITAAWERNQETLIRLTGKARRDADGHRSFVEADTIELVGGPAMSPRFAELAEVKEGWLGDEEAALAPSRRFLVVVERSLWTLIERVGVERPYVFLQPSGGIEATWKRAPLTLTVRFGVESPPTIQGIVVDAQRRTVTRSEATQTLDPLHAWVAGWLRSTP